MSKSEELSD
ncbi:unnamed protein product [Linum tenue]|uniref:Uncharacterized protein n=1 Tax=Linum tenue TaxID=586396 RepID=A0AAV0GQR8_9ROSI|nr:unnamed protein product [Linum tenue]